MGAHTCYHTHTMGKITLNVVVQACNSSLWEEKGGHTWCIVNLSQ